MTSLHWLPFTGLAFTLRLDAAAKGAMVVTGIVAFAVLLYAIGYEKRESHGARFFVLFTGSLLEQCSRSWPRTRCFWHILRGKS